MKDDLFCLRMSLTKLEWTLNSLKANSFLELSTTKTFPQDGFSNTFLQVFHTYEQALAMFIKQALSTSCFTLLLMLRLNFKFGFVKKYQTVTSLALVHCVHQNELIFLDKEFHRIQKYKDTSDFIKIVISFFTSIPSANIVKVWTTWQCIFINLDYNSCLIYPTLQLI